ncbi:MAG: hypothetical protein GMKNLPBB_02651 [Myxococcota bacterium]|nr:hypothetical protein [Myxococcota bacterium]
MNRLIFRYGAGFAAVVMLAIAASGCGEKIVQLKVETVAPCDQDNPITQDNCEEIVAQALWAPAEDNPNDTGGVEVDLPNEKNQLPGITLGAGRRLRIECKKGGQVVASGESPPLELKPEDADSDPKTVKVLALPNGKFTRVTNLDSGECVDLGKDSSGNEYGRIGASATALASGKVLIAGGARLLSNGATPPTDNAFLFDPATGVFEPLDSADSKMKAKRAFHQAVRIDEKRVLLMGGISEINNVQETVRTAEIFDEETKTFSLLGSSMTVPRAHFAAARLSSGYVVITGGLNVSKNDFTRAEYLAEVEIFDPNTEQFASLPVKMKNPRAYHTATVLIRDYVIIIGGRDKTAPVAATEVFVPSALAQRQALIQDPQQPLAKARYGHRATLVAGSILISGGYGTVGATDAETRNSALSSMELYVSAGNLGRFEASCKVAGASAFNLGESRARHAMFALSSTADSGRVLVFGGHDTSGNAVKKAEILTLNRRGGCSATLTSLDFPAPSWDFAVERFVSGQILAVGGQAAQNQLTSAATLYNP